LYVQIVVLVYLLAGLLLSFSLAYSYVQNVVLLYPLLACSFFSLAETAVQMVVLVHLLAGLLLLIV
jgi:hypothetical protein